MSGFPSSAKSSLADIEYVGDVLYLFPHGMLAPEISGTAQSTTHHYCRPRTIVADYTLWLEVEEERENRALAHTAQAPALAGALYRR